MKLSRQEILLLIIIVIAILFFYKGQNKYIEGFCLDIGIAKVGDCEPTKAVNTVTDITNQLTRIDNSIKQNIDQSCSGGGSAINRVSFVDSNVSGSKILQSNVFKNVCALQSSFKSNVDVNTQDKIAAAIAQNAVSKGGVFGGPGSSENNIVSESNTSTYIDNSKVLSSVKRCVNNLKTGNVVEMINSNVSDTDINQTNDVFLQCLLKDEDTTEIAVKAIKENEKTLDQTAKAEGGNLVESFFSGISNLFGIGPTFMIVISVILLILCIVSSGLSAYMGMSDSPAANTGRANMGKAFSKLQSMQSGVPQTANIPPSYSNFDFIGSAAKRLNIPGLYKN